MIQRYLWRNLYVQTLIWRAVITLYGDNIRAEKSKAETGSKDTKLPNTSKVKWNFSNWIFPEDHQVWAKAASQSHLKQASLAVEH